MGIISEPSAIPEDALCGESERKCKRCELCFPETTEYFMQHKSGRDGLHPWCRTCYAAYQREHYANNREARLEQKVHYREEHHDEIREQQRRYDEEHREERKAYRKKYNVEHEEEIKAYSREYYKEHRDEHLEAVKRYNLEHPHKRREQHRIYVHKRRAKRKGSGGHYKKKDVANLYEAQQGLCCWCGKEMINRLLYKKIPRELYHKMFTIEHIVSIDRGGSSWVWNIVLACWSCNCSRQSKYIFTEWQPPAILEQMQDYVVWSVFLELGWGWWMWKIKIGNYA
jgi:hypothetical protein